MTITDPKIIPGMTRWTQVFHRSRISPGVFVVNRAYVNQVGEWVNLNDLPGWSYIEMFGNGYWVTPLLDGLIHQLDTAGLPPMPSGYRVIGTRPMRLLCDMLKVVPPTKCLAGEAVIPTRDELLAALAAQRAMPKERLKAQAELGFQVRDAAGMRKLVEQLFGPRAVVKKRTQG